MLDDFFTREEAAKHLGVSVTTVENMQRDGRLPEPHRVGKRMRLWHRDQLEPALKDIEEKRRFGAV